MLSGCHRAGAAHALALAISVLGLAPAMAQEASPPAAPAAAPAPPGPPPEPEVIAVVDVAARAETALARLRELERALEPVAAVDAIEAELPARSRELAERAKASREKLAAQQSRRALDDLQFEWTSAARSFSAWRKTLTQRAGELEARSAELDSLADLWDRSAAHAREQRAPQAVAARIGEIERAIGATRRKVESQLREVLTLQNRVAEDLVLATDLIDEVNGVRSRVRSALFEPDSPPLWRAFAAEAGGVALNDEVRASLARNAGLVRAYAQQSWFGLVALPAAFALSLALGAALRQRVASLREADPRLRRTLEVFERPISAALVVAWFAGVVANPAAPAAARNLAGLVFLVPLLRVLQVLVHPLLHRGLFALAGFQLVDRVRDSLEAVARLERPVFAVELLAALACVVWLLRDPRLRAIGGGDALRLRRAGQLAVLFLGVAFAAGIAGYADFGVLLGEGTLRVAYLGVAIFACMRVLQVALRVALETEGAQRIQVLQRRARRIHETGDRLLRWLAIGALAYGGLVCFELEGPALAFAGVVLTTPLAIGTVEISLGDLAAFGISIAASYWIAGVIRAVLEDEVFPRVTLPRGVPNALAAASRYAILLLGFLFAVAAAGAELSRFAVLAGAFGVGIGFGLQNVVNNFISGLILLFERPVQVGDQVEFGGVLGEVRRIGIRSSTIRTFQGAEVIVPNGNLISESLTNWTLSDERRRIELAVGVAYGSDPERVITLLRDVALAHPQVLRDPEPLALFLGFGASSLDFELRAWVGELDLFLATKSELATAVYRALRDANIEIPFPQQDLHVRSVSPELRELVRGERSRG
jgi:small-conductance mechanosensitive channel